MIRMTSNDYYDFLEKVLERYEAGELSEEEAVQMVNDAVIDEWKSDPREPHDVPDDYVMPQFKSETSNVNTECAFTNETTVWDIIRLSTSLNSDDVIWISNLFNNSIIHDIRISREINKWNYPLYKIICNPNSGEIVPTNFTIMLKDSQVSGYRIDVNIEGIKSNSAISIRGTVFFSNVEKGR